VHQPLIMWGVLSPGHGAWYYGITTAAFVHAPDGRSPGPGISSAFIAPAQAANAAFGQQSVSSSNRDGASRRSAGSRSHSSRCHCGTSFSSRPCTGAMRQRFAALSLGDWRLRLPVLTERSPPYDPWDAASKEAPRGVRRRAAEGTGQPQSAAALVLQSAPPAGVTPTQVQAPPVQQQQQLLPPQVQSIPAAGAQDSGAVGRQTGRHSGAGSATGRNGRPRSAGLPTWLVR
jgi:hypothetical protein